MMRHSSSAPPKQGQRALGVTSLLVSGALLAWLVSGCGPGGRARVEVSAPGPVHGLRPAPNRVANSVAQAAPDLYFDLYSHVVGERHKLARIAPALLEVLAEYPELLIVIEGHADDYDLAPEWPVFDHPCRRMNRRVHFRAATQAAPNPVGKSREERALPILRHFCRQVSPPRRERAARGASCTRFAESARVLDRVELERKVEEEQT